MLDGDHQYEEKEQNLTIMSAENHTVDKFHDEAACSTKETAFVTGKDSIENSSTDCSDVEDDIDEEEETSIEKGWKLRNLPIPSTIFQTVATTNDGVVLPTADPSNFGDVRVKDSTNVHLGNKTFYKGQITIKQFIYTNPTPIQDAGKFDADRVCNENVPDLSSSKNDGAASGPIFQQNTELNNAEKFDADNVCNENVPDLSSSKNDGAASEPIFPQNTELNKVTQWLWSWRWTALSSVLAVILLAAIILSIVYFTHQPDVPTFPEISNSSLENITYSVRFVKRNEWDALTSPLIKMELPVPDIIISHTVTNCCNTQSECTDYVKAIQTFHIESNNSSDIGYNFLIEVDDLIWTYVGRDWDYVDAHFYDFNNESVGAYGEIRRPAMKALDSAGTVFAEIVDRHELFP